MRDLGRLNRGPDEPKSTPETGLYYYRARYYDSTIGRFANEDPIRFRAGIDFYSYVRNRPTGLRDPKGRIAWGEARTCPAWLVSSPSAAG